MATKNILITGFDPFGGETVNPAYEAVRLLPESLDEYVLIKREVPTVFDESAALVRDLAKQYQPSLIILVGQAGGRAVVTPEMVAINYRDASIPDNKTQQPRNQKIALDGAPDAYFTALPIWDICAQMQSEGFSIKPSYTAGTFVCNDLFYQTSHFAAGSFPVDFVHVPFLPEQTAEGQYQGLSSMPLAQIVATLKRFIELSINSL